jgi:Ca2+-binding RTX toxin-like protein
LVVTRGTSDPLDSEPTHPEPERVMFQTLKSWLSAGRPAQPTPAPSRFAPQVESLHDRLTPSAYVNNTGDLTILGTTFNDEVYVTQVGSYYRVSEDDNRYIPGPTQPPPKITDIPVASVTGNIIFYGREGNDLLNNNTVVRTVAYGGSGNDILVGGVGSANDLLYGEAGDDILYGRYGNDYLDGGSENDILDGSVGNDYLDGGIGNDSLIGADGNDQLYGRSGHDYLGGGAGLDYLYGGDGNDTLDGGVGDGVADYLNGGIGADWFRRDLVSSGTGTGYIPAYNRDRPVDFGTGDDAFYN